MIFFYGIFSLILAFFLPGNLIVRHIFPDIRFLRGPLIIGISLIATHLAVVILVFFGIYTTKNIFLLTGLLIIFSLLKSEENFYCKIENPIHHRIEIAYLSANDIYNQLLVYGIARLFVLLAVVIVFSIFGLALAGSIGIFEDWDAIASWSRWARIWANNEFPTNIYHYSQLLPTTLSIPIVFTENKLLEFLIQAMDGIFLTVIFWTMLEYNLRSRTAAAFSSTLFMFALIYNWHANPFWTNADIPTAFFTLLSVLLLLEGVGLNSPPKVGLRREVKEGKVFREDYITASIIAAGGAALTKQSGMYILFLWPVLGFTLANVSRNLPGKKQIFRIISLWLLAAFIGNLWFYAGEFFIYQGTNGSEITYITQTIYSGKDYITRATDALQNITHRSFGLAILPFFISMFFPLVVRKLWPIFIFAFSYMIMWGMFFSYDGRNAVPVLPLIAILAGWGVAGALVYLDKFSNYINSILVRMAPKILNQKTLLQSVVAVIIISTLVGIIATVPQLNNASKQLEYRLFLMEKASTTMRLGHRSLNAAVLRLVDRNGSNPTEVRTEERWVCPATRIAGCRRLTNVTAETIYALPENTFYILVLRSDTEERLREVLRDNNYQIEYLIPITAQLEYTVLVRPQQIARENNE